MLSFFIQKKYIKEKTLEMMHVDEEVFLDFFRDYIGLSVSTFPLKNKMYCSILILKINKGISSSQLLNIFLCPKTRMCAFSTRCFCWGEHFFKLYYRISTNGNFGLAESSDR